MARVASGGGIVLAFRASLHSPLQPLGSFSATTLSISIALFILQVLAF